MKDFNSSLVLAVDEVLDFIKRHISMEVIFLGKAERDDVWDYPLDSLKEAIINALVHRDYFDSGNIQIRIFDNRLEIWSPGLLPKEIDIKNLFKEHRSIPRNKEIVKIFHDTCSHNLAYLSPSPNPSPISQAHGRGEIAW